MCKLESITVDKKTIKVADIKKNHILRIISYAEKCSGIEKIILFGSALEERCKETSDIDLALFGEQTKYKFLRSQEYKDFLNAIFDEDINQNYDILYFREGKGKMGDLKDEIQKGAAIYQRG